jgi:hypothetical protein
VLIEQVVSAVHIDQAVGVVDPSDEGGIMSRRTKHIPAGNLIHGGETVCGTIFHGISRFIGESKGAGKPGHIHEHIHPGSFIVKSDGEVVKKGFTVSDETSLHGLFIVYGEYNILFIHIMVLSVCCIFMILLCDTIRLLISAGSALHPALFFWNMVA